jgi:putrescine importer
LQVLTRANAEEPIPTLKRVLGLWDLVFYGIVLIQPIAAVGLFGIGMRMSDGQMVTTLLIAMVAMMLTAVSYGRMASMYPSAGSAYTYVTRGLNVHLGFLAGWAMVLDYLIVPIVSTVYGALTLGRLVPQIPYFVWVLVICLGTTALNIRGIRTTARSNILLLGCMCLVIAAFFFLSIRYVWVTDGAAALFSVRPLYNPQTFNLGALITATSFVALTYIGFDGVTTLAEDATNPRRTVLIATTLVCGITGVFSALQIYLASLVWPAYSTFPNIETAFLDVCRRAGGPWLFHAMALTLIVACVGTALTGQVGSARLLLGMGRDSVLLKRYFGSIDPRTNTPLFNIVFVGAITIAGSLSINYENAAEVLNFGAFLAFMGVNAAVIRSFYFGRRPSERHFLLDVVAPAAGFLFCLAIWCSLPAAAKWIGGGWTIAGLLYQAVRTRGFTRRPIALSFPGEASND